jgi:hypothetical protein
MAAKAAIHAFLLSDNWQLPSPVMAAKAAIHAFLAF